MKEDDRKNETRIDGFQKNFGSCSLRRLPMRPKKLLRRILKYTTENPLKKMDMSIAVEPDERERTDGTCLLQRREVTEL